MSTSEGEQQQEGVTTKFKQQVVPSKCFFLKKNVAVVVENETKKDPPKIRMNEMDLSCAGKMYKCLLCNFWSGTPNEILKHFLPSHSGVTELILETRNDFSGNDVFTPIALSQNEFQHFQIKASKLAQGISNLITATSRNDSPEENYNMSSLFHWSYIKMKFANCFVFHCVWCEYFDTCTHDYNGIPLGIFEHAKNYHLNVCTFQKIVPIAVESKQENLDPDNIQQYFSL